MTSTGMYGVHVYFLIVLDFGCINECIFAKTLNM